MWSSSKTVVYNCISDKNIGPNGVYTPFPSRMAGGCPSLCCEAVRFEVRELEMPLLPDDFQVVLRHLAHQKPVSMDDVRATKHEDTPVSTACGKPMSRKPDMVLRPVGTSEGLLVPPESGAMNRIIPELLLGQFESQNPKTGVESKQLHDPTGPGLGAAPRESSLDWAVGAGLWGQYM